MTPPRRICEAQRFPAREFLGQKHANGVGFYAAVVAPPQRFRALESAAEQRAAGGP